MGNNNLVGVLVEDLGYLTALKVLGLGNDQGLSGEIPAGIYQLTDLTGLGFSNCSVYGVISSEIKNLINLESLYLYKTNLTGTIPNEIGNLANLKQLWMHNNKLIGTIPPELGNCINLKELYLDNNNLEGELPVELANLNLTHLGVSNNNLSGPIPDALSFVGSYYYLDFSNNDFNYLPAFNNWYLLSGLYVDYNKLTFEDLESHAQAGYMWFDYFPQKKMEEKIDTVLLPGSRYTIYSGTGGEYTEYHWYRNGELILQGIDEDTLFLENISFSDTGIYWCRSENSLLPELILEREPVYIGIDTTEGISDQSDKRRNIECYPNPSCNYIIVTFPVKAETVRIQIFDLYGRNILSGKKNSDVNSQITIDLSGIEEGIYLLQTQTGKARYSDKIIIKK